MPLLCQATVPHGITGEHHWQQRPEAKVWIPEPKFNQCSITWGGAVGLNCLYLPEGQENIEISMHHF